MATKAAPLSALASDPESADRAQQALDRLLASLDARKKPMFDPTLLALAEGFLAPTQTGGFGESLGSAAGKLRSAQEKAIQQEQEDAKARFEVEQRRADIARQRKLMEGYANIQAPPGAPAGAPGGPDGPKGVQLFPGIPLPDYKQFMESQRDQGIPFAQAQENYRKLQQDALKITEGGTTNLATGEYFPVPSADMVNIQIFGYPGTYPVAKRAAIQLQQLAADNKWDDYGALAKRIVEGPGAAPPKPSAAPAGAPFPDLPVTPGPLPSWYTGETPPAGPRRVTSPKPEVQAILDKLQTEPQVVTPPPAPAMTSPVSPQGEAPQGPLPPMPSPPEPITLPPRFPPRAPQAPALGAVPRPAAPPQAAAAQPQPVAPLRSREQLEAEAEEAKVRAAELAKDAAKRESAMPERESTARQLGFAAERVIDLTKKSPNVFGIFARPGLISSVGGIINDGIRAGTTNIALGDFQAAITKAMPGVKQEDLDRLALASGAMAEIDLNFARLYFSGQGAVTQAERQIISQLGGSASQSAQVLQKKAQLIKMRSDQEIKYADAYRSWKEKNPRASIMEFERSKEVQDMKQQYEQSLRDTFIGGSQPASARSEADALTGRRR